MTRIGITAPLRPVPEPPGGAAAGVLGERDPEYIRRSLPFTWPLITAWFRPDIRGLERIPPTGRVLLVGNHSGGNVAPDTLAFTLGFYRRFGAQRPFFQLAHHLVMRAPWLSLLRRYGMIEASWENARQALEAEAAVLVYPGGDWEAHRPSWHGDRVEFAGREGFVRLALAVGVPVVPVVSIGGQETALFLTRGERIARALRLDTRFRLKVLPVSLALPWGLNVGDLFGHVALPAKITIQVLEPIDLRERFGPSADVDAVYRAITGLMQQTLDELAADRRWPLIG